MNFTALAVLLIGATLTLAAGPATLPTQTSDGVAYGDAQPIKGWNPPNLPTIGKMLGVPAAQWVGQRKVITRTQSSAEVQQIESREKVEYTNPFYGKPEFIVVEPTGRFTAFSEKDGRIVTVFTTVPKMNDDQRAEVARQITRLGHNAAIPFAAVPGSSASGCPLIAQFEMDSLYLASHKPSPAVESAIRNRTLVKGMTEDEADAAMSLYSAESHDEAGDEKRVLYYTAADTRKIPHAAAAFRDNRLVDSQTFD